MKKGISIHIGLDYNGTLPTCVKDALDMQEIAISNELIAEVINKHGYSDRSGT